MSTATDQRPAFAPARSLLRFATAGAVDDGKSTLIGRLLHDSRSLLADQLEQLELASAERGDDGLDLAMLTDGLRAEREQGITIDVAHRYFETARRAFIIADTPGHAQYTRNMVTGASTADLAIVLVDARNGLTEQSRRHAVLAALLRVRQLVLAVNKMDLVGFDEAVFGTIAAEFAAFTDRLEVRQVTAIPISALRGDNVVHRSEAMPWYDGPSLLEHLEEVDAGDDRAAGPFRLPVQCALRAPERDYRGYAGQIAGGTIAQDEEVLHLPSGTRTTVVAVDTADGELDRARAPQSVTVRLADDLDVGRGDMLCAAENAPAATEELTAEVCWMSATSALEPGRRLLLKHTTRTVKAVVAEVRDRLDVTTLHRSPVVRLELNEIGAVVLRLAQPVFCDRYADNRATGGAVLIDEATHATVGAVLITGTH
ncbi:sulfate adenylyltransferase subunit 1 [Saccharopolyspora hordei]|uniref:sulfate adenylyltransferase n=1 Tax=Saccharopolyspora hordei TaxID=1838 RepID=A0A853ARM6_9PSEU|nr:GTP-binding protein [Saccharopolyspora hordei]NYI84091.1 bifunctional enzyme CysN/CysC/sulfate adenylyltransferase subunit 1 [Saccharopolyspora hordei]